MALSDFVRSVLQNVQYFGSNVAPQMTMKPDQYQNWLLQKQQLANQQDQQDQAQQNEQEKFQQQQSYQNSMIQDAKDRLQLQAALGGLRPADSLNGTGPSIGAGGGATQGGGPNVPPQIATTQGILNGMQGAPSQTPNAANQSDNAGLVAQRFAGAPTSANGGVVIPAGSGAIPAPKVNPLMPTVFNIGGRQFTLPDQQEQNTDIPVPEQFRSMFGGSSSLSFKDPVAARQMQLEFVKLAGGQAAKSDKPVTKEELYDRSAAQEFDPKAKSILDLDPSIRPKALQRMQELEQAPTDSVKAQKDQLEVDRMKQESDEYKATKSPEAINNMVSMMKQNPDLYDEIKDPKQQGLLAQEWLKQTGMPIPTKLAGTIKTNEDYARTTQNVMNRVLTQLQDPAAFKRLGPLLGRIGTSEQALGDTFNKLPDADKTKIQQLRSDLNYLFFTEGKTLFAGRPPILLMNQLKSSSPNVNQVLPALTGSLKSVQDFVNGRMLAAEQGRFGGQSRPWVFDKDHNLMSGQMVNVGGKLRRIKSFIPGGKVELE